MLRRTTVPLSSVRNRTFRTEMSCPTSVASPVTLASPMLFSSCQVSGRPKWTWRTSICALPDNSSVVQPMLIPGLPGSPEIRSLPPRCISSQMCDVPPISTSVLSPEKYTAYIEIPAGLPAVFRVTLPTFSGWARPFDNTIWPVRLCPSRETIRSFDPSSVISAGGCQPPICRTNRNHRGTRVFVIDNRQFTPGRSDARS